VIKKNARALNQTPNSIKLLDILSLSTSSEVQFQLQSLDWRGQAIAYQARKGKHLARAMVRYPGGAFRKKQQTKPK
jgi:hypothetical protein